MNHRLPRGLPRGQRETVAPRVQLHLPGAAGLPGWFLAHVVVSPPWVCAALRQPDTPSAPTGAWVFLPRQDTSPGHSKASKKGPPLTARRAPSSPCTGGTRKDPRAVEAPPASWSPQQGLRLFPKEENVRRGFQKAVPSHAAASGPQTEAAGLLSRSSHSGSTDPLCRAGLSRRDTSALQTKRPWRRRAAHP